MWKTVLGVVGICAMSVLLVAGLIAAAKNDARKESEWESFKVAQQCKVVAKIPSESFNTIGFGTNGQMTVGVASTSAKVGWLCNDGVTYYR